MVEDPVFLLAAEKTGLSSDDPNAQARPLDFRVPEHACLGDDEYVFTTFKWNVHTQGRSSSWANVAEIVHTDHAWMAPETAEQLGVQTGDWVEIMTYRPKKHTYRSGEGEGSPAVDGELRPDLWWSRERGGVGNGEALNHVLPINRQPLVGGQNWFDNVCRVRRVASRSIADG